MRAGQEAHAYIILPKSGPGDNRPAATRTDLHVAPLRLHEFATVATTMIVWPRET